MVSSTKREAIASAAHEDMRGFDAATSLFPIVNVFRFGLRAHSGHSSETEVTQGASDTNEAHTDRIAFLNLERD